MKYDYGVNRYTMGCNLGDEIQSIAASCFLPKVDYFIDRESISRAVCDEKIKLIMNGWYMIDHKQWPPARNIEPLLVSVNLSNEKFEKNIFSPQNRDYLIDNGPVGARDLYTLNLLHEQNIPSYFSGCLTLTLPKNEYIVRKDYVLCIDVQKDIVDKLRKQTSRKIYEFSSTFPLQYLKCEEKFKYAFGLLKAYQSAAAVITSRLHAAMPCLALETPVLLVRDFEKHDGRFDGLGELVRKADNKFYLNNLDYFDVNNLTPNGSEYMKYRELLIERCEKFTGEKHSTISPITQIQSVEEQLVNNIEIMHNFGEREAQHRFSHWYLKKKLARLQKRIYYLK